MRKQTRDKILFYLLASFVALFIIIPFLWMVSTSLKGKGALTAVPIQWIPDEISFQSYKKIFTNFSFEVALWNSTIVSVLTTVIRILSAAMAAYIFAKIEFKGREVLFALFLVTMMIPQQVTFIPLFLVLKQFSLLNTFTGLIMPSIFNAFAIFMLRQHMRTINNAYIDAAVMDGASHLKIFRNVMLPLSGPILATLGIIVFFEAWNDFLWPLVILTDPAKMTLPLALNRINGQFTSEYNTLMAGSLVSIVPILIVFIFAQRHFKTGLQVGGIK